MPHAPFDAQETCTPDTFTLHANDEMTIAQANETFKMTAVPGQVLGSNGETMAFAKKEILVAYDKAKALDQEMKILKETYDGYLKAENKEAAQAMKPALDTLINQRNAAMKTARDGTSSSGDLYEDDVGMGKLDLNSTDNRGLISRAVASSQVDRLLGTHVVTEEKFGIGANGEMLNVSVQADGMGVRSPMLFKGEQEKRTCFLVTDYSQANVQKGLYDLEAVDYITGQIDRHPGNIYIEPKSGKVTGIDNDLAFPEVDREVMFERNKQMASKANPHLPHMMHKGTAALILNTSPEALRQTLRGVQDPHGGGQLNDKQIEGAVQRLKELQRAIRDPDSVTSGFKLVDKFTPETYKEALDRQVEKYTTTSYLGAIKEEKIFMDRQIAQKSVYHASRYDDSVGMARRSPEHTEYAKMVKQAADDFKAKPEIISDAAARNAVEDIKRQIADVKAKITHYDKETASLDEGKLGAKLRSLASGGTEGRKEFYADKKMAAVQHLTALERQLDKAAADAVPLAMKEGLYADASQLATLRKVEAAVNVSPPIEQRVPLNELPPPAARVGAAAAGNPPIEARVPLQDLPPPVVRAGVAANGPPPIEARTSLQNLPPPVDGSPSKVAKKNIPAKTGETGVAERTSHENNELEAQEKLEGDSLNMEPESTAPTAELPTHGVESSNSAQTQAPRKNSVADALKRSASLPDLNTLRQGKALGSDGSEGEKPELKKDNSLRASGNWKSVKPSGPARPAGSLKSSHQ